MARFDHDAPPRVRANPGGSYFPFRQFLTTTRAPCRSVPPIFFPEEVAQNRPPHFRARPLLTARNRFRPNFRGWGLDEFLNLARPPYPGEGSAWPSPPACLAQSPMCLRPRGDACVLGVVERVGNTLYVARGVRSARLDAPRAFCRHPADFAL